MTQNLNLNIPSYQFSSEKNYNQEDRFDLTLPIYDYRYATHKNDQEDVLKGIHHKIYPLHKDDLDKVKKCKTACNIRSHTNKNDCKLEYKKNCFEICPKDCNCNYRCECGWEPNKNLPEEKKKKHFQKHFEKVSDFDYIVNELSRPRYPEFEGNKY